MCRQRAGCNPGTAKADGQRAWWKLPRGMCRQRAGCNAGTLTAASLVEAAARDVQEKGRLQTWNSKGWRPEGLVEAAARELEGFKGFKCLKPGKRQAWMPEQERAMCRQKAGCNPGTAKADGQRASWKLPRGSWRVLRVLSVWSLANGRLECPNKRGLCAGKGQAAMLERWGQELGGSCREGCAGKGQAATLEQQRLTARGLGGSCREGCAGKEQAATLEQQRLPARGLGGSCREEAVQQLEVEAAARELEGFKGFKRLKPGKRQAWMP